MANTILCTIDFSESSTQALKWAAELAIRYTCHLTVLFPYRLTQIPKADAKEMKENIMASASEKFAVLKNDFLIGKVASFDFTAEVGFLADRIDDHQRKNSILMVVISKKMSLLGEERLDDLIAKIKVPMMIIP